MSDKQPSILTITLEQISSMQSWLAARLLETTRESAPGIGQLDADAAKADFRRWCKTIAGDGRDDDDRPQYWVLSSTFHAWLMDRGIAVTAAVWTAEQRGWIRRVERLVVETGQTAVWYVLQPAVLED